MNEFQRRIGGEYMTIKSKIAAGFASAALFANLAIPAFASTDVEVSGNGAKSDNEVKVENTNTVDLKQTNNLNVVLNITSKANTGGNKASGNTGGNTNITTGDATTETTVAVAGGDNKATVPSCGCESEDAVKVSGNGKKSDNKVTLKNKKSLKADQKGDANVVGTLDSKAKTGKNKAKNNTDGDVEVKTGDSVSTTEVGVVAGSNVLK